MTTAFAHFDRLDLESRLSREREGTKAQPAMVTVQRDWACNPVLCRIRERGFMKIGYFRDMMQ